MSTLIQRFAVLGVGGGAVPIAAGIGNRKSDIMAYSAIGLTGGQIFIHLPEYASEVRKDIDAGNATGFGDYAQLPKLIP